MTLEKWQGWPGETRTQAAVVDVRAKMIALLAKPDLTAGDRGWLQGATYFLAEVGIRGEA